MHASTLATPRRRMVRLAQAGLLGAALLLTVGAGDPSTVKGAAVKGADTQARFDALGHRIMCPCGCNELLGECNHVGCPDSDHMRQELMASVQRGDSNDTIFRGFQQEYGPTALAAPMFTSFNHLAWIMPPLVLLLGIGAVFFVVRQWKLRSVAMPVTPTTPGFDAVRERIRRETEQ